MTTTASPRKGQAIERRPQRSETDRPNGDPGKPNFARSDQQASRRWSQEAGGFQGLSRSMVDSYRQAFTLFDKDGDGFITLNELGTVMRSLGVYPTQLELEEMMEKADADGNGFIEESEFIDLMWQRSKDMSERQLTVEAFTIFDRDQSGYMTEQEIQIALQAFGVHLSDAEITTVMQDFDTNGDGVLDVEEFVDMAMMLEEAEEEQRRDFELRRREKDKDR